MRIEYDDLRRSRPEKGLSKQSIDNPGGGLPDAPAVQHQTIKRTLPELSSRSVLSNVVLRCYCFPDFTRMLHFA